MVANFEETSNQCINFYDAELYTWKGLRFRSKSEIKIAEELDRRGIFFLPNCVGRIGNKSHRKNVEADFIICHHGVWAILEVDGAEYHENKTKDAFRDTLFTNQGVKVIHRASANECYSKPGNVIDILLSKAQLLDDVNSPYTDEVFLYWEEKLKNINTWESFKLYLSKDQETFYNTFPSQDSCCDSGVTYLLTYHKHLAKAFFLEYKDIDNPVVYNQELLNTIWQKILQNESSQWLPMFGEYIEMNSVENATLATFKISYQKYLIKITPKGSVKNWKILFKECNRYKILISISIWVRWVEDIERFKLLENLVFSNGKNDPVKPSDYDQKIKEAKSVFCSTDNQNFTEIDNLIIKIINRYDANQDDPLLVQLLKNKITEYRVDWDLDKVDIPIYRKIVIKQKFYLHETGYFIFILFSKPWLREIKEDVIKYMHTIYPNNEKTIVWLSDSLYTIYAFTGLDAVYRYESMQR